MRKYPIQQSIHYLSELYQDIKTDFENNNVVNLQNNIEKYEKSNSDAHLISIKSNAYFQLGEYQKAEAVLLQGLKEYPFHFDINLNAGIVYEMQTKLEMSLCYYIQAHKFSKTKEERDLAETYINRMNLLLKEVYESEPNELVKIFNLGNRLLQEKDYRSFPLDAYQQSTIRQLMASDTVNPYMTNMYKSFNINNVDQKNRFDYATETLPGNVYSSHHDIILDQPTILPVSVLDTQTSLSFELNKKVYSFANNDLFYNSHQYLRFNEIGTLKIKTDKPVFIGKPLSITDSPLSKKLVVNIFVDGVSGAFIQKHHLSELMPNTYKYFKNSFITNDCYATSEWTFPSVASMYTGKYTTNHHIFHPDFNYDFASNNKMMQEYFKEAGYMTTQIGGDWRVTPAHGYHKGFDRIIYKNFMSGGMDTANIVSETLEHLEAFKGKNNFLWISLADLHHVPDDIDQNLMTQVQLDISERVKRDTKGPTTVLTPFDTNKHDKYINEIKRIDFYLNTLYEYFNNNYQDEEVLIVLHSDHGQSFLENTDILLNESRRKVPLMIKGGSTPVGTSNELMATIDILPTLLHLAQLPAATEIDGQLPVIFGGDSARTFTYTEAIHPNQTYKAALTDDTHHVYFENGTAIQNDGLIDLNQYTLRLINKVTGEDETEVLADRADYYEQIIWEHVQSNAKF